MKNSSKLVLAIITSILLFSMNAHAQWSSALTTVPIYRMPNVGIGISSNPLSSLSVNGLGDARFGIFVTKPFPTALVSVDGAAGVYASLPKIPAPSGGAHWNRSVVGKIESGSGYAVGVEGASFSTTSSNAGRSYGVLAIAGNASKNFNYGVFGELRGSNEGAAVLGFNRITDPSWSGSTNGNWAGYFAGKGYFSKEVGIGTETPSASLSVNGSGNALYGIYVTKPATANGNGVTGIYASLPQIPGFADWNRSVVGKIESGSGYAVGVEGSSLSTTPNNAGRSYGVLAIAGNASKNYNYGVFGELRGSNDGAAVLGFNRITDPSWSGNTNGNWAGYFAGRGYFSQQVGIGTETPSALLEVKGVYDPNIILTDASATLEMGVASANSHYATQALVGDVVIRNVGASKRMIFNTHDNTNAGKSFEFVENQNTIMTIADNGKVSIGNNVITNTPGNYKLYVKDGILTEEVKVAIHASTDWADYVF